MFSFNKFGPMVIGCILRNAESCLYFNAVYACTNMVVHKIHEFFLLILLS